MTHSRHPHCLPPRGEARDDLDIPSRHIQLLGQQPHQFLVRCAIYWRRCEADLERVAVGTDDLAARGAGLHEDVEGDVSHKS